MPQHVIGIAGSLRVRSFTRMALDVALQGAAEVGATTERIDLREWDLPFCAGKETAVTEDLTRLRGKLQQAQGMIWATPEYHGSVSGVLKNFLDLMGFDEIEGKMVGLVAVSAGAAGGFSALSSLRNIGRALHAWVVPEQATISEVDKVFDPTGLPRDPKSEKRLKEVGRQVAKFAHLHNSREAVEFLKSWEHALFNPGAGSVEE